MREIDVKLLTSNIKEMCIEATHYLTPDMKKALEDAKNAEASPLGKQILEQLQENLEIAGKEMIPICQDTGMAVVFLKIIDHSRCVISCISATYRIPYYRFS